MYVLSMFFSFEKFLISPVPAMSLISHTSTPSIVNWVSPGYFPNASYAAGNRSGFLIIHNFIR